MDSIRIFDVQSLLITSPFGLAALGTVLLILGMKQRLGVAQTIMENSEVLILDEPFNGLDTKGVEEFRELLLALKKDNKLLVISSHQQENIDYLCDEVFEIAQGKLKRRIG